MDDGKEPGLLVEYNRIRAIMSATDIRNLSKTDTPCQWRYVMQEISSRFPLILHFACHSERNAIELFQREVVLETVIEALRSHNEEAKRSGEVQVQLVVFNACFSDKHAEKLKHVVNFVIGHRGCLYSVSAVEFTHTFYDSLFKGKSLCKSMQQAEGFSSGYGLQTIRNARAFCLLAREKQAMETTPREQETSMIQFFKESGFTKIARSLCEELRIEDWKLEDLQFLTSESLDKLEHTKLYPHEKKKFWNVVSKIVRESSAGVAQQFSPAGDDTDRTEVETTSDSGNSDTGDSEDDCAQREVVIARNTQAKQSFESHATRFLQNFGVFSGMRSICMDDDKQVMRTECVGEKLHEWTMCMLLWLKLAKDARMHETWREKWHECLSSPSQESMLRTLNEILSQREVTYKYLDEEKLTAWGREKEFASVIFVTHELVRASLPADDSTRVRWDKEVMGRWNADTEGVSEILQRMNEFLWSQVEGIQVITNVIETHSYVCYMIMHKVTSMILFEYLETYKKEQMEKMTAGNNSDLSVSCLFEGFNMFASSSARFFALSPISLPCLREIIRNIRIFARLPGRLLLLLGPVRRAGGLLGKYRRSSLTDYQWEIAKECEEAMRRGSGVHLQGPAETGKTFLLLHMVLRALERDRTCSVVFLLRSEDFVHYIVGWISSMASRKWKDKGLFDRIFFSFRGERGWNGPFLMKEGEEERTRAESASELQLESHESEYKYVVIDEAHHIFSDQEATEYIKTKKYDKAMMILTSDSLLVDSTSVPYPQNLHDVHLMKVVRNNLEIMAAPLLDFENFQDQVSIIGEGIKVDIPEELHVESTKSEIELSTSESLPISNVIPSSDQQTSGIFVCTSKFLPGAGLVPVSSIPSSLIIRLHVTGQTKGTSPFFISVPHGSQISHIKQFMVTSCTEVLSALAPHASQPLAPDGIMLIDEQGRILLDEEVASPRFDYVSDQCYHISYVCSLALPDDISLQNVTGSKELQNALSMIRQAGRVMSNSFSNNVQASEQELDFDLFRWTPFKSKIELSRSPVPSKLETTSLDQHLVKLKKMRHDLSDCPAKCATRIEALLKEIDSLDPAMCDHLVKAFEVLSHYVAILASKEKPIFHTQKEHLEQLQGMLQLYASFRLGRPNARLTAEELEACRQARL
eukprot:765279-Hanusia_phi.AAC.1